MSSLTLWTSYLTPAQEHLYEQKAHLWETAQKATIVTVACLGALILASPWITPLSYTDLVMQIFSWIPATLPIPLYIYTYFGAQVEKARFVAEKILFLRDHYPKITENASQVEQALLDTFQGHISTEKKQALLEAKELHPMVISHIDFLTKKLAIWEKQRKPLTSPLSYMQKEFDELLNTSLFEPWHVMMIEKRRNWITHSTFDPPEDLLLEIIKEIESDPSSTEATSYLQQLYWKWHNEPTPSFEKKWGTLFDLEEKILHAEMQRIFLWSLLLRSQDTLLPTLQAHQTEIEEELFDIVKKREVTLPELSIAEKCHDQIGQKLYLLDAEKAISREDLRNPSKREDILNKLIRAYSLKHTNQLSKDT